MPPTRTISRKNRMRKRMQVVLRTQSSQTAKRIRRQRTAPRIKRRRAARRIGRAPAVPRIVCSAAPKVSVVIPAMNERKTIAQCILNASRVHEETEVIVVANGSRDGTADIARRMGARVIEYPFPLGHDVGRSIGAREAKGDIVLFMDADFVIPVSDLVPFVRAVQNGVDVALNSYLGPVRKTHVHHVVVAKHALNSALSRPDLKGSSLTTVPHALSKKALQIIGSDMLAVPPLAHAAAIHKGLNVRAVHHIDVGSKNPRRRRAAGGDPLATLIVGDHLEAIGWLIRHTNSRACRDDLQRQREKVR